jgi:hypothetical protein
MKNLLYISFLLLPLLSRAQNYLGASKKDIKEFLKKSAIEVKDTVIQKRPVVQFTADASICNLYFEKDTVKYYSVFSPLTEINNTISAFVSQKYERTEKYKWVDYSHPAFEVIYEIKKYSDGFLTIVSK